MKLFSSLLMASVLCLTADLAATTRIAAMTMPPDDQGSRQPQRHQYG